MYPGKYDPEADYEKMESTTTQKLESFGGVKPTPYPGGGTQIVRGIIQIMHVHNSRSSLFVHSAPDQLAERLGRHSHLAVLVLFAAEKLPAFQDRPENSQALRGFLVFRSSHLGEQFPQ